MIKRITSELDNKFFGSTETKIILLFIMQSSKEIGHERIN